jgi:hypothetical protein
MRSKIKFSLCLVAFLLLATCTPPANGNRNPNQTSLLASPAIALLQPGEQAFSGTSPDMFTPGAAHPAAPIITSVPYPIATPSPIPSRVPEPYPVAPPTTQPELNSALPPAETLWNIPSTCGDGLVAAVYHTLNGMLFLRVQTKEAGALLWDWDRASQAFDIQWQSIKPFTRNDTWNSFNFLGIDQHNKQWIGSLLWDCQKINFQILLPVDHPERAFLVARKFDQKSPWGYWLVDGNRLTLYYSEEGVAFERWSIEGTPADAIFPEFADYTDLNHDGQPELLLHWYDWRTEQPGRGSDVVMQIYAVNGKDFRLIGEVQPSWQTIDLGSNGTLEFLKPVPPGFPQEWQVYGLKGEHYTWLEPIPYPQAIGADWVDPQKLPVLPDDLYFQRDGAAYRWPRKGGALEQVASLPTPKPGPFCKENLPKERVLSWSPDCRYAVVSILGKIEGASYAVFDARTGKLVDIPDSFVYASGRSTFAWDPNSHYLIHARAEGGQGLYHIDLPGGKVTTLLALASLFASPPFGAAAPMVLADGSIIFSIQGSGPLEAPASRYPPNGIYRLAPTGELRRIVSLPPASTAEPRWSYGTLIPAPDQSVFLYLEPSEQGSRLYGRLLLIQTNGKRVWNVLPLLAGAGGFRWVK